MKGLGIFGLVVGILASLMAVYLHFIVVPAAEIADSSIESTFGMADFDYTSAAHRMNMEIRDFKTTMGEYTLIAGALALLLSIVPAIKKHKIAWAGVVLGLICLLIGAAYGTHMFS